jgi:acetyltransferase-like isoleucine patch superfamily enzyme
MLLGPLRALSRWLALRHGRARTLWLRLCRPQSDEYAEYLRRHGGLHAIGEHVRINPGAQITDPAYVRIGNNVTVSACTLIGHDASCMVIGRAIGERLDSVGKIDIRDNVFIGHGAIVLPNVTIGPNAIVGAGAVVTRNVAPGTVVGGAPARAIGTFDDRARRLVDGMMDLPWAPLILGRDGAFDPAIEPELVRMRVAHFFGRDAGTASAPAGVTPREQPASPARVR